MSPNMATRKKLPCPFCPKKSFRSDNWQRHMNSVHPNVPHSSLTSCVRNGEQRIIMTSKETDRAVIEDNTANGIAHTTQIAEFRRRVRRQSFSSAPGEGVLDSEPATQDTVTLVEEVTSNADECKRPEITLEGWDLTKMEYKDHPGSDTHHILSCVACWSRTSREKQGAHWISHSLISAVRRNNPALVQHMLNSGANTLFTDSVRCTALQRAVEYMSVSPQVVKILCEEGSSLNIDTDHSGTPLWRACKLLEEFAEDDDMTVWINLYTKIVCLLEAGADANIPFEGVLPLSLFLRNTRLHPGQSGIFRRCVELLIQKTKNLNIQDQCGDTPLHTARDGELAALLLLEKGANTAEKNRLGHIPLHCTGSVHVFEKLLESNPDSWSTRSASGQSVLISHIFYGNEQIVEEILKRDLSTVDEMDKDNNTPLHHAFGKLHDGNPISPKIVKTLLKADCDPHSKNIHGNTVFHLAVAHVESLEYRGGVRIEKGANLVHPVNIARLIDSWDILEMFGNNVNDVNKDGNTSLGILIRKLVSICGAQAEHAGQAPSVIAKDVAEKCFAQSQIIAMFHRYVTSLQWMGGKITKTELDTATRDLPYTNSWDPIQLFTNATIRSCKVLEQERCLPLTTTASGYSQSPDLGSWIRDDRVDM